jgi:hypothetical protein
MVKKRKNIVNFFILFFMSWFSFLHANQDDKAYLKYEDEIVKQFKKEMRKKYKLECWADGGSMPNKVEEIRVCFDLQKKAGIDLARELVVKAVERLTELVNNHEKIRPYLAEYPFPQKRIEIMISFQDKNGRKRRDGSVCKVLQVHNKLIYKTAVMKKEFWPGTVDARDPKNIIKHPDREVWVERFEYIHEEPYEEALRIVQEKK